MGNEASLTDDATKSSDPNKKEKLHPSGSFKTVSLKARKAKRAFHRAAGKVVSENRHRHLSGNEEERKAALIGIMKTKSSQTTKYDGKSVLQEASARRQRKKIHAEQAANDAPWGAQAVRHQPRPILLQEASVSKMQLPPADMMMFGNAPDSNEETILDRSN
mmetsp:Transcript_28399/g.37138  ORF Transcript_28399/g.37138 Transcript_28399/m.37138 type:complete len:162 (+) Transcript_28399:63-548(+)